jgi:hypothetical protein
MLPAGLATDGVASRSSPLRAGPHYLLVRCHLKEVLGPHRRVVSSVLSCPPGAGEALVRDVFGRRSALIEAARIQALEASKRL